MKHIGLLCLIAWAVVAKAKASDTVKALPGRVQSVKGEAVSIYEDKSNSLSFNDIEKVRFQPNEREVANLSISESTFWLKFPLENLSQYDSLLLRIPDPTLDSVTCYYQRPDGSFAFQMVGQNIPFYRRRFRTQDIIFQIPLMRGAVTQVYLRVRSKGPILVPMYVGGQDTILLGVGRDDAIFGIYIGLIGVMLFYNLFIFFSVRDKNYWIYVLYIASVAITQITLKGYGYRYLWHSSTFITDQSVFWSGILSAIGSIVFVKYFLQVKAKLPVLNIILNIFVVVDLAAGVLSFFSLYQYSYQIINNIAFLGAVVLLLCGIILSIRGLRAARFYLIAWTFFLISVIVYVLSTYSLVPFNLFTQNILLLGSGIEITLLSFALADKINSYKKEKEISQARALEASREKEQLVREQNVILESKVKERTAKLEEANTELNLAMMNLKKAESQLVHAEKMASLGQLTAGIAHEINNPINFVKSNIRPLKMDIADLQELIRKYQAISRDNLEEKLEEIETFTQEIDLPTLDEEIRSLLTGIEEGSSRTADIVKGLRTFSRVDEGEVKKVDIHEGMDATLNLLNNVIPDNVSVVKHYGDLPMVECYPGRLNQVFMNILSNAVHAIEKKGILDRQQIVITTERLESAVTISIADTGTGIPEEIRNKIFDPFFTTKDVGEGTGLGLSMVFSIVEKHQGSIEVKSEEGKGSDFIITLPVSQSAKG